MCEVDKSCPSLLTGICKVVDDQLTADDVTVLAPFSCALNQTDIAQNCNKFFIMQLLHRNNEAFFIFSRAGRVGYDGSQSVDCFLNKSLAIAEFKKEFLERTGISWDDRFLHTEDITPAGKYQYILMKYDNHILKEEAQKQQERAHKLSKQVQELIELIYNPELYKQAQDLGLDTKRLPLGDLGKAQIQKAYKILQELNAKVTSKLESSVALTDLSSLYYSTIPTACGMSKLPLIDTEEKIKEKVALLELLDDLCAIKGSKVDVDTYEKYSKLQCNITPVYDADILGLITTYLTTNVGHTHYMSLKLHAVYSLDKLEESFHYRKWETLHNKQLLWHGTRMANVAGILTGSMKINPVGIPTTGKMFGNGLYFANSSSKSAQYMYTTSSGLGVLFLCEVALGNMYELKVAQDVRVLPQGKHSTRGLGIHTPDVDTHVEIDNNVIVPIGKLIPTDASGKSLQYDEFIVYDTTQIKLRYLVLVKT
jgi:hypothetical protein